MGLLELLLESPLGGDSGPATSVAAIRDRIIQLIRDLTPTLDTTTRFRPYENQRGANFRKYARGAPQGTTRMFQVRDIPTRQPADACNVDIEARLVTFEIIVAYVQSHRWGADAALARDDAMEADQKQIENAVGKNGYGNFGEGYPSASWMGEGAQGSQTATLFERSDNEGDVDFLVIRQTMRYYRASL